MAFVLNHTHLGGCSIEAMLHLSPSISKAWELRDQTLLIAQFSLPL